MLDSKKEASCPQTHNCLLTAYGAPRAPSASWDPIPGLLQDWVQIFEPPTHSCGHRGLLATLVQTLFPVRFIT